MDLFDPQKDYSDHYTHYPKARIVVRVLYAGLVLLILLAMIRAVKMLFF